RNAPNMPEHDTKPYYFGITFGFNYSAFQISQTENFAFHDTFMLVQPAYGPGFNLGIMGNLRVNKLLDLRFIPALVFSEKRIRTVDQFYAEEKRSIESIYMNLPFQLKIKSDRIHNFRFYGLAGGKFD